MRALILGGASCRWDDVDRLESMLGTPWPGLVIGVNEACCKADQSGRAWTRRFDILATHHAEKVVRWKYARRQLVISLGRSPLWDHFEVWSHNNRRAVDRHFTATDWMHGSSGLYAVRVAMELGCERIVLCGVPMDPRPNAFRGQDWKAYSKYTKEWREHRDEMLGAVRSMSGWTAELLGEVEPGWLDETEAAA